MEADGYGTGVAEPLSSVAEDNVYEEGYNSYSYQRDTGQDTPRARSPEMAGFQYGGNTMNQTMSEGHYGTSRSHGDDLFSRYIVEPSSRFQPGSVFKIYWSEPLGDGLNATVRSYMDKKGEKFHYSFRRFIVVASDEGHSTCVPILTYGHRACTKRGVKAQKHGIVYQVGNRPFRLHMEPELGFPPARVELFERTEKLDKESRVNYSKLVTIEHNYRVFFIGRIHPGDFVNIVSPAVDTCWGKKRRHHR
ncbi:hypothetical protein QBC38DRAFT_364942 [Podospora fimiseda]|uniref:DUF6590 domain-containing protein n=1 Tax=Podospora fimiseda TaxID=252190 RepID=A0AAN7BQ43_9PEZI|nr:hypothetical protein QBC38DRAFT_364942 [Podospora fimiseda]